MVHFPYIVDGVTSVKYMADHPISCSNVKESAALYYTHLYKYFFNKISNQFSVLEYQGLEWATNNSLLISRGRCVYQGLITMHSLTCCGRLRVQVVCILCTVWPDDLQLYVGVKVLASTQITLIILLCICWSLR